MLESFNETQAFHIFLGEQIASGTEKSPEELVQFWRVQQREVDETVAAIRVGLADSAAGRTKSVEEFDRDFRQRHNISADDV